jgi:hypothetical protein
MHTLAVFEAIADGRTAGRVYPQPRKSDYDALANDLTQRVWTQADMRCFPTSGRSRTPEPPRYARW